MHGLLQDLRFAFRQMARTPGFSLTAVLSLALGIGATVSVFSVIYSAVLNAWPYAGFDRVCEINTIDKAGHEGGPGFTGPAGSPTAPVAGGRRRDRHEPVEPRHHRKSMFRKTCMRFTLPEMLSNISACRRLLGRYFLPSDAPDGQDPQPVAVLSYKFWRRHFNGDPTIVGKNIQLVHKDYTILGVLPPRFTWMDGDVYLPLNMSQAQDKIYNANLKLRSGVSTEAAEAELRPLLQQFDKEKPNTYPRAVPNHASKDG